MIKIQPKRVWANCLRRCRAALVGRSIGATALGAGVLALCGTLQRGLCGSPYQSGIWLRFGHRLPSPPLMALWWLLWYALLGAGFAYILSEHTCDPCRTVGKYRCGLIYLSMLFLGFLWYPVFFCAGRLFLSALIAMGVLILCFLCARCARTLSRWVSVMLLLHGVFLAWLWVVNVAVLVGR